MRGGDRDRRRPVRSAASTSRRPSGWSPTSTRWWLAIGPASRCSTCSGGGASATSTSPSIARVLIPRPETEIVAGVAIELAAAIGPPPVRSPISAPVRARSGCRWPPNSRSTAPRSGSPTPATTRSPSLGPTWPASAARAAQRPRRRTARWFEALPAASGST